MTGVIADYFTMSTPLEYGEAMLGAVRDVVLQLDDTETDYRGIRVGTHGRVHFTERKDSAVATISASGMVLAKLRAVSLLYDLCGAIAATGPYKVTHLDLAHDVMGDVPAMLEDVYARLRLTGCALTRKRTPPHQITQMLSPGCDGRDTGTVFIGNRKKAETTAAVYDRRHDALCKGKDDPGPLLRYEIRTGVPGMSLKDLVQPEPLFYHFASPDLLPRPATVPDWQPWGEAFTVGQRQDDAMVKLARYVERSGDLRRLHDLAQQVPGGTEQLRRLLNQRLRVLDATAAFEKGSARHAMGDSEAEGRPLQ